MAEKVLTQNGILYYTTLIDNTYVKKETGKGLSTNDFTDALKDKLESFSRPFDPKGRVDTVQDLPTTGNKDGDLYYVGDAQGTDFEIYAWLENTWKPMGRMSLTAADYTTLTSKPKIEGVTLEGNKTATELGLALDSAVVHKTGNESIAGNKTFTGTVNITSSGGNWVLDRSNNNAAYIEFKYNGTRTGIIGKGSSSQNSLWINAVENWAIDISAQGGVNLNGSVKCAATPTENAHVANKLYVDNSVSTGTASLLSKTVTTSQTVASPVTFDGALTVTEPTADANPATKKYVDDSLANLETFTPITNQEIDAIFQQILNP